MSLGLVAIALAAVDLSMTVVCIKIFGREIEANSAYNFIISRYGLAGFCLSYVIIWGSLISLFSRNEEFLVGVVAVLALIIVNNVIALARLL